MYQHPRLRQWYFERMGLSMIPAAICWTTRQIIRIIGGFRQTSLREAGIAPRQSSRSLLRHNARSPISSCSQ